MRKSRYKVVPAQSHRFIDGPYIRVTDRRARYHTSRRLSNILQKYSERSAKFFHHPLDPRFAPNRVQRLTAMDHLKRTFPKFYERFHNCNHEYKKLLSWRSAQGAGGRKRTLNELVNNRKQFNRKDC